MAGRTWIVGWLRKRTNRLMFWATAARKNCSRELQSPQAQATQSDLILEFYEQSLHFLSLPLCFGELGRVGQLPGALPGWFLHVDGKKAERSGGALGL